MAFPIEMLLVKNQSHLIPISVIHLVTRLELEVLAWLGLN